MKKYASWLSLATLVVLLPSCCVFNAVRHPQEKFTMPEIVERETVAMVHWIGEVGKDEDDDPIIGEVDPDKDPKAELKAYCAGVWVSQDTILTAEHCIDHLGRPPQDPLEMLLRRLAGVPDPEWDPTGQPVLYSTFGDIQDDSSGKKIRVARHARVLAVDPVSDLSLLEVEQETKNEALPEHRVATIASTVHVGDDVHIVGHTLGLWWSYTHGWVAQLRPRMMNADEKQVDLLQISAPVFFGNSGGGAWNTDGELLGIASFIKNGPNLSFFIDFNTIRHFLSHHGIKD